jgi:PAS domain S-box-containing protein
MQAASRQPRETTQEPIRILLVEDNPGDVALMEIMISEAGEGRFRMQTADRLSSGFERLSRETFDLILLDLTLPDAHGLETVIRMNERAPRIPLIVMTGLDDEELAFRAMQHGAQDYVVKGSVDGRLLVRAIRYALERTRTERELREQRTRLDMLLNNIPDRIYFKNHKGEFIQVNPALARFFGVSAPDETLGKTDADFFTEEHTAQAMKDEAEVMRTGKPLIGRVEKETFPDGRTVWSLTTKMPLLDEKGAVVGTFGVSRDITDLKMAETALQTSEERYRRLLNSVTDYVYSVELKDGQAVATSHGPGCLAVTGYSPEEFRSDPWLWHRLIHPDERDQTVAAISRKTSSGEAFEIEHRIVRKDGEVRWVRNKHVPRTDADGRLVAYDGLISDITERKNARDELLAANERLTKVLADLTKSHEELKVAQSQLMQVEKLHSIGQLAAGIAHEVKNPLQVMVVGLQYLTESPVGRDELAQAALKEMAEAVQRADGVIRDLLDFSSPRELGMQARSINTLIERSLRFVKHDLTKGRIKIVKNLAPNLPHVLVDPPKIEQVFINLFTNAGHAMPDGGTLTVTSSERRLGSQDFGHHAGDRSGIRLRPGDPVVVVEVCDDGTGISKDHLHRVFEPFFTTKSTGKGTGLGLSVTKRIIDLHKGQISIANNENGGVTVTLVFKAHASKNPTKGGTA